MFAPETKILSGFRLEGLWVCEDFGLLGMARLDLGWWRFSALSFRCV